MNNQWLDDPSVTLPMGWSAGARYVGIKTYGPEPRFDLGLLVSELPCAAAGIFTRNTLPGAPVILNRMRLADGRAQALVVNSGCSNVAMGERGQRDASKMAELAAARLGLDPELVLVASTGVIARPLPMERIAGGLEQIEVSAAGGGDFSRAIMTTDTVAKARALKFEFAGKVYTVAGTAKGSGMAHPDMATVFCFLTTDAAVDSKWLADAVRRVGDSSVNMLDVDMDTSTSDMMLAFANGAAQGPDLGATQEGASRLEHALHAVAVELTKDLARDGEGATALIEVVVDGAVSLEDARKAARTIVSSPLVKSMITGRDANLGRVLMALGRSGAAVDIDRLGVWIGDEQAFDRGSPTELALERISEIMAGDTVRLSVDLGLGSERAVAWGCNLTADYVHINADYTT